MNAAFLKNRAIRRAHGFREPVDEDPILFESWRSELRRRILHMLAVNKDTTASGLAFHGGADICETQEVTDALVFEGRVRCIPATAPARRPRACAVCGAAHTFRDKDSPTYQLVLDRVCS